MKKYLLLCFVVPVFALNAQNLVPNPSFEDTISCPENFNMITDAFPWFKPNTASTDVLHECASSVNNGVPLNRVGYQNAKTGVAYAGIYARGANDSNYREHLEVKLLDSLESGKCYKTEFYYSLADTFSSVFVTNMGVYFTVDSLLSSDLYNLESIEDTVEFTEFNYDFWYRFSVDYLATGGEQFLTIGNFNDNLDTDTLFNSHHNTIWSYMRKSYFYIDDVSVVEIENHEGCICLNQDANGDCMFGCVSDFDNNGVCDNLDIEGCMDSLACNYNSQATVDDGSCSYGFNNYVAQTACGSYTWLGDTYTESGTYYHNFVLTEECDSSVFLHLTIEDGPVYEQSITICEGDSVIVGDSIYTASGLYTSLIYIPEGCDSLVYTNLTVLESPVIEQSFQICQGDSVVIGDLSYFESGDYDVEFQAYNGCDSIVKLSLTVFENYSIEQSFEICNGESVVVGDSTYYTSGEYINELQSLIGCDSTIYTELTVHETPLSIWNLDYNLQAIPEDYETYTWNTEESGDQITPGYNGTYWAIATDENDCVSDTAFFTVDFIGVYSNDINTIDVYPNPASSEIVVKGSDKGLVELYTSQGQLVISKEKTTSKLIIELDGLSVGEYLLKLNNEVFRVVITR